MTPFELNLLESISISPEIAVLDKKLAKGRWDKVWHKVLPESFGIEIEIPSECFNRNTKKIQAFNSFMFKYRSKTLKLVKKRSKSEILKNQAVSLLSSRYTSLGTDIGDYEFRGFITKYNLQGLEDILSGLSTLFNVDSTTILNLHIHLPISQNSKVYKPISNEYIQKFESIDSHTENIILNILKRLMFDWRPRMDTRPFDFTFRHYISQLKIQKLNHDLLNINNICRFYLPIRENGDFNTLEFRGMSGDFTYRNIMSRVIACGVLNKFFFSDTIFSTQDLKHLENIIY